MRRSHIATIAGGLALVFASPAQAQDDPRLAAIEAQIRALQDELGRVRRDLAARDGEVRAARQDAARARAEARARPGAPATPRQPAQAQATPSQAAPSGAVASGAAPSQTASAGTPQDRAGPPSSVAPPSTAAPGGQGAVPGLSFPKGRPTWTSSDGRYSAAVGLQLHYDLGGYFNGGGDRTVDTRGVPRLNTFGQNLRRGRIPFVFTVDDFQVNITPDFGGTPDGSPTLYEANVNWAPIKPLTVTAGYFKPWYTLQDSMSSNDFLLLERPAITEVARSISAGDARSAFGARWTGDRYFVAAYLTGDSYGSQTASLAQPQQTGGTVRVAGRPVATENLDLHLGFSASSAFRIRRTSSGQTITLQDRPEVRIDTNRLVSTGALNASGAYTYGPEFAFRYGPFMLQGEYIQVGVDRDGPGARLPELQFRGGYAEASYVFAGQPRAYSTSSAAFRSPQLRPDQRVGRGGWGAWEAVARYSVLDLDDRVTRGVAASTTRGVYGGRQEVVAVGVNWYPNENLRLMLDYDIINVDRVNAAGTTQIGQRIQAVAARLQAAF